MKLKYLPNLLSLLRLIIVPFFVYCMLQELIAYKYASLFFFFIGSLSDLLDGYIARRYNYVTDLGKYLDPFADKILILSAFFLLSSLFPQIIKIWMICAIFMRDFFITFFRLVIKKKNKIMETSKIAKLKTLFQIILIHFILILNILNQNYIYELSVGTWNLTYLFMLFCTLFSLITGANYLVINLRYSSYNGKVD